MTECAQCGDCCENIKINVNRGSQTAAQNYYRFAGKQAKDAAFVQKNMHPTGEVKRVGSQVRQVFNCDKFDKETRLCTAHNDRPSMCSDYPWYGKEPNKYLGTKRCSFWIDVKPEDRPEGAVVLIPLTVINSSN